MWLHRRNKPPSDNFSSFFLVTSFLLLLSLLLLILFTHLFVQHIFFPTVGPMSVFEHLVCYLIMSYTSLYHCTLYHCITGTRVLVNHCHILASSLLCSLIEELYFQAHQEKFYWRLLQNYLVDTNNQALRRNNQSGYSRHMPGHLLIYHKQREVLEQNR